jgi:hypothetical protein
MLQDYIKQLKSEIDAINIQLQPFPYNCSRGDCPDFINHTMEVEKRNEILRTRLEEKQKILEIITDKTFLE